MQPPAAGSVDRHSHISGGVVGAVEEIIQKGQTRKKQKWCNVLKRN